MSLLKKTLQLITGSPQQFPARPKNGLTERELIELESEYGKDIFGPVPADHRREFFCLDEHTWIWYEEWIDVDTGATRSLTTRYELHESGIMKVQDGGNYRFIEGEELHNLTLAIRTYYERVMRSVYKKDPFTGESLRETPATI